MFEYHPVGFWNPEDKKLVDQINNTLFCDASDDRVFTKRIEADRKYFRNIISGKLRKELKRQINNGSIVGRRGKGGKFSITIPRINIPHIVHGSNGESIGRGKGKPGDVIGRDRQPGKGEDGDAGEEHADGIRIVVDLEEVIKFLQQELQLPDLKPKQSEMFEEIKYKYNDISLVGPESLRHSRRTFKQALKRNAGAGSLDKLQFIPGYACPMPVVEVLNCDKRYRQYKEIKIPSSNAVIFFARDWSGSMGDYKCDIISDMSWWIDCWIRRFYKRVERCWVGHDTLAEEVDEATFYNYRYGGGTKCSSAFSFIEQQLENRFPPRTWNIYVFYFTDGDNFNNDNTTLFEILKNKLGPEVVNMVGITQVCAYRPEGSVKNYVDKNLTSRMKNVRTVSIGDGSGGIWGQSSSMSKEDRDSQILDAIKVLLGSDKNSKKESSSNSNLATSGV